MVSVEEQVETYLGVGRYAVLQPDLRLKECPRFTTSILGWKPGRSILIEHPKATDGREATVRDSQPCVLRFVHEGNACAFSSTVLGRVGVRGEGQVSLNWPERVELQSLRRFERIRLEGPCKVVRAGGEIVAGHLKDLSIGGCGLLADERIPRNEVIEVQFSCPEMAGVGGLKAVVRVSMPRAEGQFIGCEFEFGQELERNSVCLYVGTELARGRNGAGGATPVPKVLVVDSDAACLDTLRGMLSEKNVQAFGASCTVDAMYALRAMQFQAVAVSFDLEDLPGLELCRLLRASAGLEKLTVLLYGGTPFAADGVLKVHLNRWLPSSPSMLTELASEIVLGVQS